MIEKANYRDQVKEFLLQQMNKGTLLPGDSISLAQLSRELDVSVTPIREALSQLQQVALVVAIPNRGFVIPEIDTTTIAHSYELVTAIESLAVEYTQYDKDQMNRLEDAQLELEKAEKPLVRLQADMKWHKILISEYNNPLAQQFLSDLKVKIFFFERSFMNMQQYHDVSEAHHRSIMEALYKKDKVEAIRLLKKNWMQILNYIKNE